MQSLKQTLVRVRAVPLFVLALIVASLLAAVTPQPAQAMGEKYTWKNSNSITATGGVFGSNSYELKLSRGVADAGGKPVAQNMFMINDLSGIKDPSRNCNLRFGLVAQTDKSKGSLTKLYPDIASGVTECADISTMSRDVSIGNSGSAGAAPDKLTVNVSLTKPTELGKYTKDTITLKGANDKTLGTKDVKASAIKIDGDVAKAEVVFKDINGKQESFLEACSKTLSLCSKSGNLAELLSDPLQLNEVTIEINQLPPEDTGTTCAIDGIGWIVCPVMTFMAKVIDKAYLQVADWLKVTPIISTGGGAAMRSAWVAMRDIANVAFVIAFMVIVYSQLTSAGITNYGIKKLLPKIVIAAILVNVSYIICAIAVDISNITGQSLYSLLHADSFTNGIDTSHFEGDFSTTGEGWAGIVAAILASSAIIYAALPALIVALPAALLAIVTVFLVLALRQVLIILLIVVSPLAFIALLLPNTEDWFKRWRKLFVALLAMYPIISLLFGASALASTVVMNSATDTSGDGKIALQLMGALITVLPLVLTPIIMKASSGVLNRFAGVVNNPNRGPFDAMRKRAEQRAGIMRDRRTAGAINRGRKVGNFARTHTEGRARLAAAYIGGGEDASKARQWLGKKANQAVGASYRGVDSIASGGKTSAAIAAQEKAVAASALKSGTESYLGARAKEDTSFARKIAGNDGGVAIVQAYAQQAVHDDAEKDVKAQQVRLMGVDIKELSEKVEDSTLDATERAAAARIIAERGGHQHVQQLYDYMMSNDDAGMKELQEMSAEAMLRRKPAGVSATTANAMKSGTMKAEGFMKGFEERIEIGKFSAQDIAKMDVDDHVRIAELAASGKLSDAALTHLSAQLAEIAESDTMKLSPEQERILTSATLRQPATRPDGSTYGLVNLPGKVPPPTP